MSFSYSSLKMGISSRFCELWYLYHRNRRAAKNTPESVRTMIAQLQRMEATIFERTGVKITGINVLEIGSGQKGHSLLYFAAKNNKVTGIDLDEIVQGFSFSGYYRMWRKNGMTRVFKTLGRKILGVDWKFTNELVKQLGIQSVPKLEVLTMDASNMTFPEASFDFVFSRAVFEHLAEPEAVINEVVRVLRPGGVAYLGTHLYTSDSGCHDPRIFSGNRSDIPLWSHLRPQHMTKVQPNAYLNKLRINQWDQLFANRMPGVFTKKLPLGRIRLEQLQSSLKQIRQDGELQEYTDEELLTVDYVVIWQKPESL